MEFQTVSFKIFVIVGHFLSFQDIFNGKFGKDSPKRLTQSFAHQNPPFLESVLDKEEKRLLAILQASDANTCTNAACCLITLFLFSVAICAYGNSFDMEDFHMKGACLKLFCLSCAIFLMAGTAQAKDSEDVFTLGEIVVNSEKPGVKDISIHNVIDAKEIEAIGAKNLVDALHYAPGVYIGTGRKNQPNISIHGFDQSRTLILLDGIPYTESYYGKLDLRQIPSSIISRIEITKGAPSVLYGANYLGAVINVITKKGTQDPSLELTGEMSDADTYRVAAAHANTVGNVNYWLSYERSASDGWWLSDSYSERDGGIKKGDNITPAKLENGGLRDHSDYDRQTVWGRVGVTPTEKNAFYLSAFYTSSNYGIPVSDEQAFIKHGFSDMAEVEDYADWGFDFNGSQEITEYLKLRALLYYHNHQDEYQSYSDPEHDTKLDKSKYKDYIVGGSLFADIEPVEWDTLRLAFHYSGNSHKDRKAEDENYAEFFSYIGSVGIENELNYGEFPTLVVGASYDWTDITKAEKDDGIEQDYTDPDAQFNPMIGLSYQIKTTNTRVYGSIARKTRFPALNELFSSKRGNPELETERSINYVLGAEQPVTDWLDVEISGFAHEIDDYITLNQKSGNKDSYDNIGKVEMLGFEAGAHIRPIDDLTLSVSYTYNHVRDRSEDRVTEYVEQAPEHLLSLGADYLIPVIDVAVNLRARYMDGVYSDLPDRTDPNADEVKLDDFFVVDGRISKSFLENYEVYFEMKNIFDEDYVDDSEGYPAPGRNFLVGVKASF